MDTKKYNGWTNYANWRIALEMFDGYTAEDLDPHNKRVTAQTTKNCVEQYIEDTTRWYEGRYNKEGRNGEGLQHISAWANAFLADVNWQEIADHLNDEILV